MENRSSRHPRALVTQGAVEACPLTRSQALISMTPRAFPFESASPPSADFIWLAYFFREGPKGDTSNSS